MKQRQPKAFFETVLKVEEKWNAQTEVTGRCRERSLRAENEEMREKSNIGEDWTSS